MNVNTYKNVSIFITIGLAFVVWLTIYHVYNDGGFAALNMCMWLVLSAVSNFIIIGVIFGETMVIGVNFVNSKIVKKSVNKKEFISTMAFHFMNLAIIVAFLVYAWVRKTAV